MAIQDAVERLAEQRAKTRAAHDAAMFAQQEMEHRRNEYNAARERVREAWSAYHRAMRDLGHEIDVAQGYPDWKGGEEYLP